VKKFILTTAEIKTSNYIVVTQNRHLLWILWSVRTTVSGWHCAI